MKRVDTCRTKEVIPPERDEAACPGRSSVASQSRSEEAPELLAGYLGRIGRDRLLTPEEELDLGRQARAGDVRALARVIEKNLRLVVSVAKRYRSKRFPFEDLIQEGTLDLMRAVDGFDPERGNRFATYATWWIGQAIGRALSDKARAIRIPAYVSERQWKVSRARAELSAEIGENLDEEQVSQRLGWKTEEVTSVLEAFVDVGSLESLVSSENVTGMADLIEDERSLDPADSAIERIDSEKIRRDISGLSERLRRVIVRRYGLQGGEPATLAELGRELGLTRERVRQPQREAEVYLKRNLVRGQIRRVSGTGGAVVDQ